jgi:hypothetical protein
MKAFHFPLERVLSLRRTQLELEDARFRQSAAALAAIDRARAELGAAAVAADLEVRSAASIAGADLAALDEFHRHVRSQEQMLAGRRAERARELAAQQAAMLEARRRYRLLERLRERRLAEWKTENDRELEQVAAESYLARWGRVQSSAR